MEQASKELTESLSKTNTSIQGISTAARELSSMMQSIESNTIEADKNGKGFSVVASEMRKLAVQSKETAEQVVSSLQKIEKSVNSVLKDITMARNISDDQHNATNEICKNITDISQMSEKLINYSKK
ncbi:MAG: hypothetical protein E7214_12335 [Clostridium sp.]|nr:hypothetical protein [Clostridium sp.]